MAYCNYISATVLAALIIFSNACKKDDRAVMENEFRLSENSSLNVEIKELKGALKSAADDYQRSVIHTKIAAIESEKGDVVDSIKSSQEAIKFQPNQYMPHYLLGKDYIVSGRFDDAVTELGISIELNSKFAPSHFELGNAYYKKFRYKDAADEYSIAVKLDPKNIQSYNNLGVVLSILGREKESEAAFRNAVKLDPSFAPVYRNLGILYDTKMKNKILAVQNYKKYLELAPDSPDRRLVKMWISALGV